MNGAQSATQQPYSNYARLIAAFLAGCTGLITTLTAYVTHTLSRKYPLRYILML